MLREEGAVPEQETTCGAASTGEGSVCSARAEHPSKLGGHPFAVLRQPSVLVVGVFFERVEINYQPFFLVSYVYADLS